MKSKIKNSNLVLNLSILIICGLFAQLLTESSAVAMEESESQSVFTRNQNFDEDGVELYETNWQLKSFKKFGFGLAMGGITGTLGLNVEANVQPSDALAIGIGGGAGYNAMSAAWKHNFESQYLSLYTKVGYSKWFNTQSTAAVAKQSDVLNRVLSQSEISQNRFNVDFLVGGAGFEYNQLEGELSGVNLFAELMALTELDRLEVVPTGSVGITYFY